MTKKEVVWPAVLIVAAFSWMLVFSFEAPRPLFGQRWLLVLSCGVMWASISLRVWRGRYDA